MNKANHLWNKRLLRKAMQGAGAGLLALLAAAVWAEQRSSAIAYVKAGAEGPEIWRVQADGTGNRLLGSGSEPSWSPDGLRLAVSRTVEGNTDIYLLNAEDGGGAERLTTHPAADRGPAWSPDGSMIAFNSDRSGSEQVWRSNVQAGTWGYNLSQLTQDNSQGRVNNFISWSPDGRWLAFEADRDRDDPEIYLANAVDGSNQQRLTFTRALDEVPAWSPDSARILFSSDMHGEPLSRDYDIYIMQADGSEQRRLTFTEGAASYPSMSADGSLIAYSYSEPGTDASSIMLMDADGGNPQALIADGGMPRFSPF